MREMINKVTFLTNIFFMMLNNGTFIVQWLLLFQIKEDIGGYTLDQVMLLWGLAACTYGLSHVLFQKAFELPELIINGKLDSFLVQPKNVLLSVITSATNSSAIGDVLYGFVIMCVFSFSFGRLGLFILFSITGAIIITAFSVLVGSLSFWIVRGEMFGTNLTNILISFATYPDGIFKGAVKFILYILIPVGMTNYLPVHIMTNFNPLFMLTVLGYMVMLVIVALYVFYKGLKRYSSSSLMVARM
jgi:ABC-2 type transport system permease protein